jgi:hypothetical protein
MGYINVLLSTYIGLHKHGTATPSLRLSVYSSCPVPRTRLRSSWVKRSTSRQDAAEVSSLEDGRKYRTRALNIYILTYRKQIFAIQVYMGIWVGMYFRGLGYSFKYLGTLFFVLSPLSYLLYIHVLDPLPCLPLYFLLRDWPCDADAVGPE